MRKRTFASAAVVAGLALASVGTPVAQAEEPHSNYVANCAAITITFTGFPNLPNNRVLEKVRIDGVKEAIVHESVFNGPTFVDTIPLSLSNGHHSLDVFDFWNTNGVKGNRDQTLKHGINCLHPILFVHGIEGSGAQFESQAMRFESNAYPATYIDEVDYNSTLAVGDKTQVDEQIDTAIAALKKRTGEGQVDLVAHSLGTSVSYSYMTEGEKAAARRANIAHYINVDGQASNPGVPTLAVWAGRGTPGRKMTGAENVTIPNQTHVQTCTSAESFIQYFKFLNGKEPAKDIVPQKVIQVAGKAVDFPQNTGLEGGTVQVWPLDSNGVRIANAPLASIPITDGSVGGGAWGPVTVEPKRRYEFTVVQVGLAPLHIYYEPFVRSDYTLRLEASPAIQAYTGNRPGSVSSVSIRYKELWGDQPGESDQLLINGLNIATPSLTPAKKQVNAFFAFDRENKKETNLTEDPVLGGLPFIQGTDVYIPASPTHSGTVAFQLISRGGGGTRTLNVPNWDSSTDGGVTLQWNDFEKLTF